jgi:hypothetical protein
MSGGAPDECEAPKADCDESKVTGCESNLLSDTENCGACRARCSGVCANGTCQPFETLSMKRGLPTTGGIVRTNTELFVLSNAYYDAVLRWSEEDGARPLIDEGMSFREIALATDRLYLSDEQGALWSLPLSGGTLTDEKQTARSLVSVNGNLYALDELSTPYELSPTMGARRDLPLPSGIDPNEAAVMAGSSGTLVLLGDPDLDVGGTRFEIYLCHPDSDFEWQEVATGNGKPVQARLSSDSLYVSVRVDTDDPYTSNAETEYELRSYSLTGKTRTLSQLSGVVSFEVVYANLYVSVERADDSSALRVLSVDDPSQRVEFRTSTPMRSLTYVEPYFYFGDTKLTRFSRLRDWLN